MSVAHLNATDKLEPIDYHVASRIRMRRAQLGRSRRWLAEQIQVSDNQMERIERGTGRAYVNRLFAVAEALQIHPGWFFEGFVRPGEGGAIEAFDPAMYATQAPQPRYSHVKLLSLLSTLTHRHQVAIRDHIHGLVALEAETAAAKGDAPAADDDLEDGDEAG